MKKTLLSISTLSLMVAPITGFLYSTKTQVVNNKISEVIKTKMEETSLIFKESILANANKMNSGVVSNVLNNQDVSLLSNIDSTKTLKDYNKDVYDYEKAEKYITKINKSNGFNFLDSDAPKEAITKIITGLTGSLKSSYDKNGLKPEGTNELLNGISYVASLANSAVKPETIDQPLTKLSNQLAFLKNNLPNPPTYDEMKNVYGIDTFQDMHDVILTMVGNMIVKLIAPDTHSSNQTKNVVPSFDYKEAKQKAIQSYEQKRTRDSKVEYVSKMTMKELYDFLYNTSLNLFALKKSGDYIKVTNLGNLNDSKPETIKNAVLQQNASTEATADMFEVTDIVYKNPRIGYTGWEATLKATSKYLNDISVRFEAPKTFSSNYTSNNLLYANKNNELLNNNESAPTSKFDIKGIFNFIYILSWYISSYDQYKTPPMVTDVNINLFSSNVKNTQIFKIHKLKALTFDDVQDKGLSGFISMFKNLLINDKLDLTSTRALKILFQVDDDFIPSFDKAGLTITGILPPKGTFDGVWSKSHVQASDNIPNGLAIIFQPLMEGLMNSDTIKNQLPSPALTFLNLSGSGHVVGALLASLLANNDNSQFFIGLTESSLISLIGRFVPNLKKWMDGIKETAKRGAFNKLVSNLINDNLSSELIGYKFESMLKAFGITLPEIPDINIREIMDKEILGFTLGKIVWLLLDKAKIVGIFYEDKAYIDLVNSVLDTSAQNKYNFYDQSTGVQLNDLSSVLGYLPDETKKGTDLALVFGMMKFNGFNKTIGIRNKNDETGEILYGHKAWKKILGYDYDNKKFESKTLLSNLSDFIGNKLGYLLINTPLTAIDDKFQHNLNQINYDRERFVLLRSNKTRFTNEYISNKETNDLLTIEYKIQYKVKKDVYTNYKVNVTQNKKTNKWIINIFTVLK